MCLTDDQWLLLGAMGHLDCLAINLIKFLIKYINTFNKGNIYELSKFNSPDRYKYVKNYR